MLGVRLQEHLDYDMIQPRHETCADPGIFVRGGGGVQVYFFSPQLILQKSNGQFQKNLSFFKVPEGVQHFPGGGGPTFSMGGGGVQLLIPYRNPYNL